MNIDIIIKKCLWVLKALIIFSLGVCAGYIISSELYKYDNLEKEKVEFFIGEIISSVINQTDFCKNNSKSRAYEELQNHSDDLTVFYKINVYDKTFHAYESIITFDNGKEFYADVIVFKDDIKLNVWKPN